jgi:hypothetical protein
MGATHQARLATKRGAHDLTRDDLGYGGFVGLGEHERAQVAEIRRRGYLNADSPAISPSDRPMQIPEGEPLSDDEICIRVAHNMKKFMQACHLTPDQLANETEAFDKIDRTTVYAHLKGKRPARPTTQWAYIQVFSKKLNLTLPPDSLLKK